MKLGNKIRKYRQLNDMSQKELGMKVGFSATTADSRIRKYESDAMAPKADIRAKIAEALNIDLEAISDIDVSSFTDIMYVLFELEEEYGLKIEKKDGKTYIVLDDSNKDLEPLISFLTVWKGKADDLANDSRRTEEEKMQAKHEYDVWKSHFATDINDYYAKKEKEITDYYKKSVSSYKGKYAETTSDIVRLLRKIVESGLSLSTKTKHIQYGMLANGFTFRANELLNPPTDESKKLFSQFLAELEHFKALGADVYTDVQIPDGSFTITYYIVISSFSLIVSHINDFLRHYATIQDQSEFSKEAFEDSFEVDLETFNNNIEYEIKNSPHLADN